MLMACGLSGIILLCFIFNHGFFKALLSYPLDQLFMAVSDEQDMRRMWFIKFSSLTYIATLLDLYL